MTPENPDDRPSAAQALEFWAALRGKLTSTELGTRLVGSKESPLGRAIRDEVYRLKDFIWTALPKAHLPPLGD